MAPNRITRPLVFAFALLSGAHPAAGAGKPNILFVLIDDLGWMDLACQGNARLHTPHIDAFAGQGMRFTDAYASAPVCSPTRAAILTGQSPARLAITNHLPEQARFTPEDSKLLPAEVRDHLPLEAVTIAERLKDGGYATAFIGKWHLYKGGNPRGLHVRQRLLRRGGRCKAAAGRQGPSLRGRDPGAADRALAGGGQGRHRESGAGDSHRLPSDPARGGGAEADG
jgi:arylsulfatase A-like enzyme